MLKLFCHNRNPIPQTCKPPEDPRHYSLTAKTSVILNSIQNLYLFPLYVPEDLLYFLTSFVYKYP